MPTPAYFIFDAKIHDPAGMQPYQAKVADTYHRYGGQLLVLGGQTEVHEGLAPQGVLVILQFPSMEQARAWHDSADYQAIIGYRLAAATTHAWLVEGLAPTAQG